MKTTEFPGTAIKVIRCKCGLNLAFAPDAQAYFCRRCDPYPEESPFSETPSSVYFALFKHMAEHHGLTLLDSEMEEICRVVHLTLPAEPPPPRQ